MGNVNESEEPVGLDPRRRLMRESVVEKSAHSLKVGLAVSIQGKSSNALAALVTKISQGRVSLKLARATPRLPFREGEPVRIKYWDWRQGAIVYYWEAQVFKISGSGNQDVVISISDAGVTVQRRKCYRIRLPVPFSFTVIDASETSLIGKRILNARTQNISVGGLAFGTTLPLKAGDKLEMALQLSPSQRVNAVAWVVRAEPIILEGKYLNSVALEFLHLEAEEQEELLQFLVESQSYR